MDQADDFSAFASACWPRLVRTAVLLGCHSAEAEGLAQMTLERCLRKWDKVRRAEDRAAYVHRVLLNTFTSSRRRRWTGELATDDPPDRPGHDETSRVDDTDAVLRALERLSRDQRAAVVLRYYCQFDERQMAVVLDVAAGTVKSRLSRALSNLATDRSLDELRGTR